MWYMLYIVLMCCIVFSMWFRCMVLFILKMKWFSVRCLFVVVIVVERMFIWCLFSILVMLDSSLEWLRVLIWICIWKMFFFVGVYDILMKWFFFVFNVLMLMQFEWCMEILLLCVMNLMMGLFGMGVQYFVSLMRMLLVLWMRMLELFEWGLCVCMFFGRLMGLVVGLLVVMRVVIFFSMDCVEMCFLLMVVQRVDIFLQCILCVILVNEFWFIRCCSGRFCWCIVWVIVFLFCLIVFL